MKPRILGSLVAALLIVLPGSLAFAQVVGRDRVFETALHASAQAPAPQVAALAVATPQLAGLTTSSVTIALLAALVAFLTNAYNTGSFFGIATVPVTLLPYIGVSIPFLGAVYASLSQAGALSGVAILNALLAGFFALLGSAGGAAAHGALKTHFGAAAATKLARMKGAVGALLVVGALGAVAVTQSGCSPATAPVWVQIENTVLADVENGTALSAIEAAVVALDPALAGIAGGVDAAIQAAIDYLVSIGAIPAESMPQAQALKAQIALKAVSK